MDRFNGKVAFVMGAASKRGMGHAIALRLAKEGANLVVADKYEVRKSLWEGDEEWRGLKEVVEEIGCIGREAIGLKADVSKSQEVDKAMESAVARFGKIDILVNCAGTIPPVPAPLVEITDEVWDEVLATNLTGAFYISRAVGKHLIKRNEGGKILHISSMSGKIATVHSAPYGASKFGVVGLVQSLALDMAPYKINVNAICPGVIWTNFGDERHRLAAISEGISVSEIKKRRNAEIAAKIPLGRAGLADDIADIALFLVSSHADYMTGQAINFTGGLWMT